MLDPIGSETPVTQIETAQYPAAPAAPRGLSDQLNLGYQQDPAFTANADHSGMYQDTDGLWRISGYRWEHVSMDLVTKLPAGTHGYDAICVIVDRLSKMVHFVPCKESMNAMTFARLFINNVFKLHGLPAEVLTDRGAHFNNKFWHAVKKLLGMKTNMSTAYRPQSDGQTERYNRVLEEMLRHYISPTQADWPDHLALAEFAVNNSWQESIHSTPFFLNTGQSPVTPGLRDLPDGGRCPSAHAFATWWKEGVAHARRHMADAQARYKRHADTGLKDVEFEGPGTTPQGPGLQGPGTTPQGPAAQLQGPGLQGSGTTPQGPGTIPPGLGLQGSGTTPQGPGLQGPSTTPQGPGLQGPSTTPQGPGTQGPGTTPQGPGTTSQGPGTTGAKTDGLGIGICASCHQACRWCAMRSRGAMRGNNVDLAKPAVMQQHATRDTSIPNSAAATSTAPKCAASQPAMKCGPASLRSHQSSAKRPACSSVSQPLAISERNRVFVIKHRVEGERHKGNLQRNDQGTAWSMAAGAWQVKHGRVDCKHGGRAATNKEPARTVPSSYPVPSPGVVTWSITDPVAVRQNPVAQDPVQGRNLRIKTGKVRKFVPRYVGPFVVEAKINANAYRLTLPANMSRLHPVFHVSLLKKYSGSDVGIMPPPVEWMDETPVYYVERLLDHRYTRAGKAGEYLVQWEGYDASFNTWEPRANLTGCDKLLAEYNAIHCLK
ncbi:hypothetical protein QJQ45_021441 [Haematococcus lacustris]|nr:hypothetical protein QJQ45_021441 [Haematococcus lacustris]